MSPVSTDGQAGARSPQPAQRLAGKLPACGDGVAFAGAAACVAPTAVNFGRALDIAAIREPSLTVETPARRAADAGWIRTFCIPGAFMRSA